MSAVGVRTYSAVFLEHRATLAQLAILREALDGIPVGPAASGSHRTQQRLLMECVEDLTRDAERLGRELEMWGEPPADDVADAVKATLRAAGQSTQGAPTAKAAREEPRP